MTIRTLRDGRYVVETQGGTYVVTLDAGECTCPDAMIRGARCKHLRRVTLEVNDGTIPAPDERVGVCAVCGVETFVPMDATGPQLCGTHALESGAIVTDRETGKKLMVTTTTSSRVDEYETDEGTRLDVYETNAAYGTHEPVIEAVYVDSLDTDRIIEAKRYAFPASRLRRVNRIEDTRHPEPQGR